jgi:hypothetical protein
MIDALPINLVLLATACAGCILIVAGLDAER